MQTRVCECTRLPPLTASTVSDYFNSEYAKITPNVGMTPDVAQSYLDELSNQGVVTRQPTGFAMDDGIAFIVGSEFRRLKSPDLDDEVFIGFGTYLFSRLLEEQSRYHSP